MDVPLKALVGRRYETAFLADDSVAVRGFDIDYVGTDRAPGKWFRQGLQGAFDICEQAFSHFLVARDQGCPLLAIPVFPSRFFPHFGMFVGVGSATEFVRPLLRQPYREARRCGALLGGVPVNTVLTLSLGAVHDHPGLPRALLEACEQASELYRAAVISGRLDDRHQDMHLLELQRDKPFPWICGVNANRAIIDRMIRYCVDQGVIETPFAVEDLFVALPTN